jgi:hypothetical protein
MYNQNTIFKKKFIQLCQVQIKPNTNRRIYLWHIIRPQVFISGFLDFQNFQINRWNGKSSESQNYKIFKIFLLLSDFHRL